MELSNIQNFKSNGEKLKIAIIVPYFNEHLGLELLENTKKELLNNNVKEENISVIRVPGALEITFACKKIITRDKPDAVITLGAVIRGETTHYELVTEKTYEGIMQVQLETLTPIIFGVQTCETEEQAKERCNKDKLNKGKHAAIAALIQTAL